MNTVKKLQQYGQSIWLDYIRRDLLTEGELENLVHQVGVRGVTSNPTIFEKAISGSNLYDQALENLSAQNTEMSIDFIYESLVIEDIRMAADILFPVYEETNGNDGYVSLEVSPNLAYETLGTVEEARRLWKMVDRPNLMIKIPATPHGISAISSLISVGININATLIFSVEDYESVALAYINGLKECSDPDRVTSVASVFVSRVDTVVDTFLLTQGTLEAHLLLGKIAISNCKSIYQKFRDIFYGEQFSKLRQQGCKVQRPLWASTGTKNPVYSDVLYVDDLIAPETVNTLPPSTLEAFQKHGSVKPSLVENLVQAESCLGQLLELDIDLEHITKQLQDDGVKSFCESFEKLKSSLQKKINRISTCLT